jgi:hypothetical protein
MSFSQDELRLGRLTSDARHSASDIGEAREKDHKSSGNGRGQRHFGSGNGNVVVWQGVGEAGIR